jgi:hypothetical protein
MTKLYLYFLRKGVDDVFVRRDLVLGKYRPDTETMER